MMGMTVDDGIEAALQRVLRGPECFIGSGFPSHQEIARMHDPNASKALYLFLALFCFQTHGPRFLRLHTYGIMPFFFFVFF